MPLSVGVQFSIIVYSFLAGLITGILFDVYRIIRGSKIPKLLIVFEDFLFGILTAIIVFTFLLYTDYAFFSVYVFLFIIIGMSLYIRYFSSKVLFVEMNMANFISKGIRICFKNIIYPFKVIFYSIDKKR